MRFDVMTRTIVVSALASALVAIVIVATRHTPSLKPSDGSDATPMNPVAAEHRRCKELGLDATNDDTCRALWAKDHDQFFGLGRPHRPRPASPPSTVSDRKRETNSGMTDAPDVSNPGLLDPPAGK
jgi:conjugative transfer region protein TrbK